MPVALTRQHSTPQRTVKRPESPIKRSSSARLSRSGRSPSPFSPNTSHNEMPAPHFSSDSTAVLKPAGPVRRRSARLSSTTVSPKVNLPQANGMANGNDNIYVNGVNGLKKTSSLNGPSLQQTESIQELDEHSSTDAWSHAVPNGHAPFEAIKSLTNDLDRLNQPVEQQPQDELVPDVSETVIGKEVVRPQPASAPIKQKIDWEIPRKTLHSSIGVAVLGLYSFGFTIPPIVAVLSVLLVSISALDFIRLRTPWFEALYEKSVGFLMRESEKQKVNGTVWYLIGVIIVLSFYPADLAIVSILILSWADTAASTIGRLWGRYTPPLPRRIPYIGLRFAPRKSTAGYAAAWVTGGIITAAFLSTHASTTPFSGPAPTSIAFPAWNEVKEHGWQTLLPALQSRTNFVDTPVKTMPSSWSWNQRVGGGWYGLIVMAVWSGFVTAVSEAIDLGDMDDNLTLPVLSGLGIWAYVGLLNWIDERAL